MHAGPGPGRSGEVGDVVGLHAGLRASDGPDEPVGEPDADQSSVDKVGQPVGGDEEHAHAGQHQNSVPGFVRRVGQPHQGEAEAGGEERHDGADPERDGEQRPPLEGLTIDPGDAAGELVDQ